MPRVVIIAVVAYFTYGASLAWTGSALAASVISAVVAGYVATMIAPSYDTSLGSSGFNRGLLVTSRQAAGSWRVIYGQTRVGGIITFLEGSTDNQYLHIVITLSGHVLREITTVYFNDEALILDASGNVTAPAQYVGFVRIKKSLGDETSQPFPDLVLESAGLWTDAHRQNGRGKVYVRLLFNSNAFPQGVPNVTALVKGRTVYDPRSATYLSLPGTSGNYASTPDSAAVSITGDIDLIAKVAPIDWADGVNYRTVISKGAPSNLQYLLTIALTGKLGFYCDSPTITAESTVALADLPNDSVKWIRATRSASSGEVKFYTSDDGAAWTQLGTTVAAATGAATDNSDQLEVGLRSVSGIQPFSGKIYYAEVRNGIDGTVVAKFDPTETTPADTSFTSSTGEVWTINQSGDPMAELISDGWTQNAALCVADYLTNTQFGCGMVYATEIDDAALIAAANECDESVTIIAGTEARYTCNGAFVTDEAPEQVLPRLLTAMAGRIAYIAGQWKIYAGAYVTPTLTLDQNDLAGPIKIIPKLSKRDLFNRVRGVYIDPNRLYQETDFPPITKSTYLSQDNNEQLWMEMNLPFTQSAPTAQRIAKIELERCRQQIAVLMRCKLGVYRLQPGDTVMVSLDRYGWEQKVFEVQDVRLAVVENGALVVDITAREHTSEVFTWGVSEESEVDPAPDTNLPDPFNVLPPSAPSIVEENYEAIGSGGLKTKVTASWTAPNDFFTQSGLAIYQLEYKLAADSIWIVVTNIKSTTYTILDFPPGFYHFRVKAFNVTGVSSPYSGTTAYDVVGLTAAPTSVQSFSAHPTAGLAQFTWAPHPDIDVRIGGKIEVRHTSVNSYTWPDSSLIGRYDGIATSGFGPLVQGTYLAKALDTAAVYSNTFAAFPVNEVLFTGFTTVASVVEHTTFVGTKVNLQVTASRLEMTDPSSLTATYFFPGSVTAYPTWIDLGSVSARRFESDLQLFRFDDSDLIDSRGAVDTWPSVDGGAVDQGEVLLYLRATDDNPSGAPTWGPWTPFRVAELNCRATQFKAEYEVTQTTHNVSASELAVHVRVQS
jgi:hypothetical protein